MAHQVHSLFIGRFQPIKQRDKALISAAISEGKNICVGIIESQISKETPYTIKEIKKMIRRSFPGKEIRIALIPDSNEMFNLIDD